MITVVIHALTAQESILADLECDVSVGQVGALYWCTGADSSMSFKNIYWDGLWVGVRALWEYRKCGDRALRMGGGGRADSSSWRVGVEIQWIIKSTALLVCECHQCRENMTCRNVTVCCCGVECGGGEGGDPTVPIWVPSLPFLPVGSPGPGARDHFFLDYCSGFWTLLSRVKYSPFRREVIILWLDQDSSRLRKLQWLPSAFSMAFEVLQDQIWLPRPALSPSPPLHTLRVSRMEPDMYPQYFPCIFESWISPKHKSLKSSFVDPSIFPWANIIPPFPKSCFAWHFSVIFSYNYFTVLCEPMEGKIMLVHLAPILT